MSWPIGTWHSSLATWRALICLLNSLTRRSTVALAVGDDSSGEPEYCASALL